MNFSTVPPYRSRSRRSVSWYRRRTARTSSGSSRSARAVDPTRSTNTAVTTFRSSRGLVSTPSGAPHALQNRASSGFSRAHRVQTSTARVYAGSPGPSAKPADRVARVGELADQDLRVLLVPRLQRQLRLRLEHADVSALAVVLDRE